MTFTFKKISFTLAITIVVLLFFSCSDDDTTATESETPTNYTLLPLSIGSTWTYDVNTDDGTNPPTTSEDEITANGNITINSMEYTDFTATPGFTGTMSTLLDQNNFRTANGIYYMYGDFTFPLSQLGGTDIVIQLNDAKLIDQNQTNGTTLTTETGSTTQNISGYDIIIDYTLSTVQKETLNNYSVNNQDYTNVVASDIVVTATVSIDLGFITQTILPTQNVYVITNYYADDVGLIDSEAIFTYEITDIPGVSLPIPSTATIVTTQKLATYTIN